MSPRAKRCTFEDGIMDDVDDFPSDEEPQDDATRSVADLGMLGDVLLDILDELCQVRELLAQYLGSGSQTTMMNRT